MIPRQSELKKRNELNWYAFYVKPRHEKKTIERLEFNGFATYCPMIKTKVRWSDRWKKVTKPLINGYIFAKVTNKERLELMEDPSVYRTVCWKGIPAIISEEEIQAMRDILEKKGDVNAEHLKPGQIVTIASGQLKGRSGEIVEISKNEIYLHLESMNLLITVKVPIGQVE